MTVDKHSLAQSCMCMFHYNVLLHFWQNDPGLFHANAATWEWNGHQNNRQHKKLFREKKICLPILLGIKPIIFRSRVWCSATESNPCWQWCWGQWCNTWSKINPLLAPQAWRIWSSSFHENSVIIRDLPWFKATFFSLHRPYLLFRILYAAEWTTCGDMF